MFPKRLSTNKTAEIGINVVSTIFNDYFGWIFRRTHQEHDFGVDAYIDFVTPDGRVTGQFIAAQIKTGKSYISPVGNMHWYKDTKEHLNYFLNLPTPILLIICDPDTRECYWSLLDKSKVDFGGEGWRYPIPKSQRLCRESMGEITALFGDVADHVSDFEDDVNLLNLIDDESFIQYSVPKEDIEKLELKNLKSFIGRVTRNEKLTLAIQGKLYISTYGYERDHREVHQIQEIRAWAKKARAEIEEWFLCASGESTYSTLVWMATCTCGKRCRLIRNRDGSASYRLDAEAKEVVDFLQECFVGLNKAADKWGWSEKYVYEVSKKISKELCPNIQYPKFRN